MAKYVTTLFLAALCLAASPARAQSADDLFNSQTLQRVDLWVNSADWAKLGEDPLKPQTQASYEGSIGVMLNFARARIAFVKCALGTGSCQ